MGNRHTEWSGEYSDKDPNNTWALVTPDLRTGTPDDGQFWMPIDHFLRYMSSFYVCKWGTGYRGDVTVEPTPGAIFYIDNDNFTQLNSGQIRLTSDYTGKSGYLVHLKCLPECEGKGEFKNGEYYNAGLGINMIYKNYKQSGQDNSIPAFGFYLVWSNKSDVTDFMFFNGKKILNTNKLVVGQREARYQGDLPNGSVFVVPWIQNWDGQGSPFHIRIIAEGKVTKIEGGWQRKELDMNNFDFGSLGLNLGGLNLGGLKF